jgi:PEP-CTERM motif
MNDNQDFAMKSGFVLLSAVAALLASVPAQAITIGTVDGNGNVVDTSFSTASMLSIAIDASNNRTVSVQVLTDLNDPAVLPLNGLVRNLIGLGITQIDLALAGASFANLGGASGTFGSVASVSGGSDWARIRLAPAENVEVAFGDWFLDGSASDFGIRLEGNPGSFTLSVTAVPEPDTIVLWAAGLAGIGILARRRRNR